VPGWDIYSFTHSTIFESLLFPRHYSQNIMVNKSMVKISGMDGEGLQDTEIKSFVFSLIWKS
jgi:hypothetical protein